MTGRIVPLAGVAQQRERRGHHPGDAGSSPAPRSIIPFPQPRQVRTLEPLVLVVAGLLAAIATVVLGLAGYAASVVIGGLPW